MATAVWFRNPVVYIRECVELLCTQIVWDRGFAIKKNLDPLRHAELHFPPSIDFRLLMVGDQGTAELRRGHGMKNPVAVYPTWECGQQSIDVLESMLENPVGDDRKACSDTSVPPDERPVFGQEHRVVVTRPPAANTKYGRDTYVLLAELQEDYPDAILHVHGTYSFRWAFGLGFASADVDPRTDAAKGNVLLGNGRQMRFEDAPPEWVRVVGYQPGELKVPRNRCMFNMRSAQWAGEHYTEVFNFRVTRAKTVDTTTMPKAYRAPETRRNWRGKAGSFGDKFLCDICSLADDCKLFRVGAVCSLEESEVSELAKMMNTRDSDKIISGLGALLAKQADRLELAVEKEEAGSELDPNVTKLISALFADGVKLAKLVNPKLAGGVKVEVHGASAVAASTPNQLVAALIGELEAEGYDRSTITPELIKERLALAAGETPDDDVVDL